MYSVSHDNSPYGVMLSISLSPELIPEKSVSAVAFQVLLEGKYPFQAPKVLCRSSFVRPSFADGRDLLRDVIGTQWSPSLTMNQLIVQLPAFVVRTKQNNALTLSLSQLSDIGMFHLGHPMRLDTWTGQEQMRAFDCEDLEAEGNKKRVLAITEVAVLLLEPSQEFPDHGHLISWANFQSIGGITKSRQESEKLTFQWKAMQETPAFKQVLKVSQADACLLLINENMQRLGISDESQTWIAEEEVTAKALTKVHISEVLQEVEMYESYLKFKRNPETLTKLLELYQHVVEYYSALNDPKFGEYLEKMRELFQNEREETNCEVASALDK